MARVPQIQRDALNDWRRENGRFVARETGTSFLPAVLEYDPPVDRLPEKVALSLGDMGLMPHAIAQDESVAHLCEIAHRPDIDPGADLRGALLQGLARSEAFGIGERDPFLGLALVIASIGRRAA